MPQCVAPSRLNKLEEEKVIVSRFWGEMGAGERPTGAGGRREWDETGTTGGVALREMSDENTKHAEECAPLSK